jgi:hypothetical protein
MNTVPVPSLLYLVAGALVLVLEGLGARVGERKQMRRGHIAAVVVAAALVAVVATAVLEPWSLWTVGALSLSLVGFAACEPNVLGERAALGLGLAAVCALFGQGPALSAIEALVCVGGAAVVLGTLAIRPDGDDPDAAVEAGTRVLFVGGAVVAALGVGCLVPSTTLGRACVLIGLGLCVGIPPVHGPRVDLGQGAPPGVASLAALPLVTLAPLLAERVVQADPIVGVVVCALSGLGLPLVALAQLSMRRLFAVLATMQGMLPVAAALVGADVERAAAVAACAVVGLACGVAAVPSLTKPLSSWEDTSGVGRLMPWRAGLVVCAAAGACGLPPTMGYAWRRSLIATADSVLTTTADHAHAVSLAWLPFFLVASAALAALPIVRLSIFLFAKTPRAGVDTSPRTPAFLVVGVVVAVSLTVSGLSLLSGS